MAIMNKDDLRALQALCVEINEHVVKEHSAYARYHSAFTARNSSVQLMLELEKWYFDFQHKFAEEVKESSDLEIETENKKTRDNCYTMRGMMAHKQEMIKEAEQKAIDEVNEIAAKKNKLINQYEKLKKKVGI